jgi:hypothetical protein
MNKDWVNNIYNSIKDFSNIEKQRELWLGLNENYASSFDEDINLLYYSFCFDEFIIELNKESGNKKVADELVEFKNMLDSYEKPNTEKEILEDSAWLNIVNKAGHIVKIWDVSNL